MRNKTWNRTETSYRDTWLPHKDTKWWQMMRLGHFFRGFTSLSLSPCPLLFCRAGGGRFTRLGHVTSYSVYIWRIWGYKWQLLIDIISHYWWKITDLQSAGPSSLWFTLLTDSEHLYPSCLTCSSLLTPSTSAHSCDGFTGVASVAYLSLITQNK